MQSAKVRETFGSIPAHQARSISASSEKGILVLRAPGRVEADLVLESLEEGTDPDVDGVGRRNRAVELARRDGRVGKGPVDELDDDETVPRARGVGPRTQFH